MRLKVYAGVMAVCFLLSCFAGSVIQANEAILATEKMTSKSLLVDPNQGEEQSSIQHDFELQWSHDYGDIHWWSARYEGPGPIGDADNDGENELLIGGRDPFLRVMEWDAGKSTYVEKKRNFDLVFGIGYGMWFRFGDRYVHIPVPSGSATGFDIGDVNNDGENEIVVAWGRHASAFKWNGRNYKKIGSYIVSDSNDWQSTLDCIIGDCDNDGINEVVVTGGYSDENVAEVIVLSWNNDGLAKKDEWNAPGRQSVYFPWIADVDADGENEIIVGPSNELVVLNWDGSEYVATVLEEYSRRTQVFGCVAMDSDNDDQPEIHVTFYTADLEIWEWNGTGYDKKYAQHWDGEDATIEAVDVGDVDDDGIPEVCVGTNYVHVLQWDGSTYQEEAVITETFGLLAVTAAGDCDNDGIEEIHAGAVGVDEGESYLAWVFKHS